YVQFLKGLLLIVFSLLLVFFIFSRGLTTKPDQGGNVPYHDFKTLKLTALSTDSLELADQSYQVLTDYRKEYGKKYPFVKLSRDNVVSIWKINEKDMMLEETLFVTKLADGSTLYNGGKKEAGRFYQVGHLSQIDGKADWQIAPLNPFSFIENIKKSSVVRWGKQIIKDGDSETTVYYQNPTPGKDVLRPGLIYKLDSDKGATVRDKFDFVSLMLALFLGTAALPHILIRYYTVPSPSCARKSTIIAIAAIGLFYVLTLYMGLGAMVSGVIDLTNDNMSAPLLAKSFGTLMFAIITAVAFATVLGTVAGLILAASGAVAHDLMDKFFGRKMSDRGKVMAGKITAVIVGCIAIALGIAFKNINVSFLVGWAFAVAASANLPAIVMLLFWKKTTSQGIAASIFVGLTSALGLILLSQKTFNEVYHLSHLVAPVPLNNPAIISVPLSFITLVVVSLLTQPEPVLKCTGVSSQEI
ncbi:MAG: cation acetate symporter, partial [Bacillota bacterium]